MRKILRLARKYPVTLAAWLFALLMLWPEPGIAGALFISGLGWIPIQIGLTGMMNSIQRKPVGPRDWQMIAAQVIVTALVAYVCIMGDMAAEPDRSPRVADSILLGAIVAWGATRFASELSGHGGSPGPAAQGRPRSDRVGSQTDDQSRSGY